MITAERLRELLSYDPETGVFTWKLSNARWIKAGDVAGTKHDSRGYRRIDIDAQKHYAHRLAWLYMTGAWPKEHVDHISGDKSDNRFSNLREATRAENMRNAGKRSHNTSGFKGAFFDKRRLRWYAEIRTDGKKRFLGYFDTPDAAHEAYRAAAYNLHGEFARAS